MTAPDTEGLLRRLAPQVLGAVVRRYGHFADAEDAVQEALVSASVTWPDQGLPDDPRAWLIRVAARRLTDIHRSESARRRRQELASSLSVHSAPAVSGDDDSVLVLFMCCHPALNPAASIPLALRAVCGLSTREIARAFLVPEATMAQRISRAKLKLKESEEPLALSGAHLPADRLRPVLHMLYLMFNEGYTTSAGPELARSDLAAEAIRLARLVDAAVPDEPEVEGLLALMLLTEARRPSRTGPSGELVPLSEQDRSRWDEAMIAEGVDLVTTALMRGRAGQYQVQAAVAAVHDRAASYEETHWDEILALYDQLCAMSSNPVIALNRVVALAMVRGPRAGLEALSQVEGSLAGSHRVEAVRGHLLEMAGERLQAAEALRVAASAATNSRERDYLVTKAARLSR